MIEILADRGWHYKLNPENKQNEHHGGREYDIICSFVCLFIATVRCKINNPYNGLYRIMQLTELVSGSPILISRSNLLAEN